MTRSPTHSLLDLEGRRHSDPPQLWAGVVGGSIALHLLLLTVAIPLVARVSTAVSGNEGEEPISIEMIDVAAAPAQEETASRNSTSETEAQPFQANAPSPTNPSEATAPPSVTQPASQPDIVQPDTFSPGAPQPIDQAPIAQTNPTLPPVSDRPNSGSVSGTTEQGTPANPPRESAPPVSDRPADNPPQSPSPPETASRPGIPPVTPPAVNPPDANNAGQGNSGQENGSGTTGDAESSDLPRPGENSSPSPTDSSETGNGSDTNTTTEVAVSGEAVPGSYIANVSVAPVPASEAQDVPNRLPVPTASSLQFTYDPAAPDTGGLAACVVDPESIRFLGSSVSLQVVVDANGRVLQTFIRPESQGLGESYRSLAQCLVNRWSFSPALNFVEGSPEGIPVATDQVIVTVTIERE